jgi:SagB-type dehydrogenase family enzyme
MDKTRDDITKSPRDADINKGVPPPALQLDYNKSKKIINLFHPNEIKVNELKLSEVINNRKSYRNYSEQLLTLEELSWLLWATQGVKEIVEKPVGVSNPTRATLRTVPSSGACHPFETYIIINKVEGLRNGLYRYLAIEHKLLEVKIEEDLTTKIAEICWRQYFIKSSAIIFIWVFVPYRTTWRYGTRGLRALMEAGHICQNLYLSAQAISCGVCAIDAFDDNKFNEALGIDGIDQFIVYIATVGKKK